MRRSISGTVVRAEPPLQARHLRGHRVEDAAVLACQADALRRGPAIAEKAFEDRTRVVLRGERRRRRPPRQRVHVDAAVAVAAVADQVIQVDAHFERRQRRVLAKHWCRDLIRRDAVVDIGALRVLRVHTRQPRARSARVIAVGPVFRRVRRAMREATDDDHLLPEGGQRLENRRQLEARPDSGRLPVVDAAEVHRHAVRTVDEPEAARRCRRGLHRGGERRDHGVEQRQRDRRANPAQERAPRQRALGGDHDEVLLMWKGVLRTIPSTMPVLMR